jgi:hypothetical protein
VPLGPPNLASTVDRFSFPVTLRRYAATTTNADGLPVRGASADTTIRAHVWDAPAEVLELLPEGARDGRVIEGHTTVDVRTDDVNSGLPADLIVYDGRSFRVLEVTRRSTGPTGAVTVWRFVASEVERP